jgi:hypothetical protein
VTLHAFTGDNLCTHVLGGVACGADVAGVDHYMSKANLYRAAIAGRPLPDSFTISLRYWLIKDADLVPIPGRDNVRTDVFTTALRTAISTAEEWRDVAAASRELGQEADRTGLGRYIAGQNHQATYCANTLLRAITRELYADEVSEEERYG